MEYCKITENQQAMDMPMNYRAIWNLKGDEEGKEFVAKRDKWLKKLYTEEPEYDPETQYITNHWEKDGDCAMQVWEVHDKEILPDENPEREEASE